MTTKTPVNPRATVRAVFDESSFDREHVPAGQWHFFVRQQGGDPAGILFGCPCGCGEMHSVSFRGMTERRPSWIFDGNRENPTLSPSINILQFNEAGVQVGEHWHGHLEAGVFKSC